MNDGGVLVLRASRLKWTLVLIASLAFVAAGCLIFAEAPGGRLGGAVTIAFFGLGAVVAALQMASRARLELSAEGFTVVGLGRRSATSWQEVVSFQAVAAPGLASTRLVEVTLSDSAGLRRTRAAVKTVTGMGRVLPDTYGMRADALAGLMNEWRARHGGPQNV